MGGSESSEVESKTSNPFYAFDSKKESELGQLLKQFSFVSIYEDELFKRCSVIEHKETKQLIITKEIVCQDQTEMNQMYQEFERRKNTLTNINLLRLRYVVKKKTDGIFTDQYKIILFFDYIVASLQTQYANRAKKQSYFLPEEINIILCGAVRGYAALQNQKILNNKARLKNIYFGLQNGLPLPKVIDSKLFPNSSNIACVLKRQDLDDIFLSPQELKYMQNGNYNNCKSAVYTLGISLLQLCLLIPSKELYNYEKKSINYQEIQSRLNIIKNKYPLSVFYLIREMLERNDDSRPSFTKLSQNLPENIKNLPQTMNISLMKNTNSPGGYRDSTKILPSTGYTKLISPIAISKSQRKLHSTTLATQYRPNVDISEAYTNGNKYTGQKKDNLRHGKGKYQYNDHSYYYGDWFKGKMEGHGQLYDENGNLVYEGEWKDDHYQGKGKLLGFGTDWIKYEGQFRAGRMEGFGQMHFIDGKRYKGEFRNDYPSGKGRMFGKNGQVQAGIWQKGNFVSQY